MTEDTAPSITGIHHFSVTVCDIEASVAWYQRVFRAQRVPMQFPHYEREDTGYGVLLVEPRSGLAIGLHTDQSRYADAASDLRSSSANVSSSCSGE
jgi:glyoxylase I family protein